MRQFFIGLVFLVVVVAVGGAVASVAYQAGLSTAITSVAATAPEGTIVTPVIPGGLPGYGYGYGYGPGPGWGWHGGPVSGIVGFFVTLFVIFIFFGILRAVVFGGRRGWGGPGGPGGRSGWGHEHNGERPWERQAREVHDAWHRENAASGQAGGQAGGQGGGTPPTDRPASGA